MLNGPDLRKIAADASESVADRGGSAAAPGITAWVRLVTAIFILLVVGLIITASMLRDGEARRQPI